MDSSNGNKRNIVQPPAKKPDVSTVIKNLFVCIFSVKAHKGLQRVNYLINTRFSKWTSTRVGLWLQEKINQQIIELKIVSEPFTNKFYRAFKFKHCCVGKPFTSMPTASILVTKTLWRNIRDAKKKQIEAKHIPLILNFTLKNIISMWLSLFFLIGCKPCIYFGFEFI